MGSLETPEPRSAPFSQERAVAELEPPPVSHGLWHVVRYEKPPTSDEWACAIKEVITSTTR